MRNWQEESVSHESFNEYIKLSKVGRGGKRKVSTRARGVQEKGTVCRRTPWQSNASRCPSAGPCRRERFPASPTAQPPEEVSRRTNHVEKAKQKSPASSQFSLRHQPEGTLQNGCLPAAHAACCFHPWRCFHPSTGLGLSCFAVSCL